MPHSKTWGLFFFLAVAASVRVFCFNPKENRCTYEALSQYTFEHLSSASELVNLFKSDWSLFTDPSYILFNNTTPDECVFEPADIGEGTAVPCTMIGIVPTAGITLDLEDFRRASVGALHLHNLTIAWKPGEYGLFTVTNCTYMGCKTQETGKNVSASFQELYTDVEIESHFKSAVYGRITVVADRLTGHVTFMQTAPSDLLALDHLPLYVRMISHGEDVNFTVSPDMVMAEIHASKVIYFVMDVWLERDNSFIGDISDCSSVSMVGDHENLFNVSFILTNVDYALAQNGQWLNDSNLTIENSTIEFSSVSYYPRRLELGNNSYMSCPNTFCVREDMVINGDCTMNVNSWVGVRTLNVVLGSLKVEGVEYFMTDYFRVSRIRQGSFSLDVPIIVYRAIQPGSLDVHLSELNFWSHSSGIELVFDMASVTGDALEYRPISVGTLTAFWHVLPVNVRFEYGMGINEVQLQVFTETNSGHKYELLRYEKEGQLDGNIVFNYYAHSEQDKRHYSGFTPETSIFHIGYANDEKNTSHLMYVSVQGEFQHSHVLCVCISAAVDDGLCPSDGSYIWISTADYSKWTDLMRPGVTELHFMIQDIEIELIDLSLLDTSYEYSIILESTEVAYFALDFPQEVAYAIKELSLSFVDVVLPSVSLRLERLSSFMSFTSDMAPDAQSTFQYIGEFVCDHDSLTWMGYLLNVSQSVVINGMEEVTSVSFVEGGWEMVRSAGSVPVGFPADRDIPVKMMWPTGKALAFRIDIRSANCVPATLYSSVDTSREIKVFGSVTWPIFHINGTHNSYNVWLRDAISFLPFEFDLMSPTRYQIILSGPVKNQTMFVRSEVEIGHSGSLFLSTDTMRNAEVVFQHPVIIHGSTLQFGERTHVVINELRVFGAHLDGSELNGGTIRRIRLIDNGLVQITRAELNDTEVVFNVTSPTDTPTLILRQELPPERVHVVHQFKDEQYTPDLKWYWANPSPLFCGSGLNISQIISITDLAVEGTPHLHLSMKEGTSAGRECVMLVRKYERLWTVSTFAGLILGLIVVLTSLVVLAFKCGMEN